MDLLFPWQESEAAPNFPIAMAARSPKPRKHVTAETCIPNWGGESMDDDMVVGALMQLDSLG